MDQIDNPRLLHVVTTAIVGSTAELTSLLDDGSDCNLIRNDEAELLDCPGRKETTWILRAGESVPEKKTVTKYTVDL